ncbi:unnamed protein product, partial [Choristocarpus tenellus]
CVEQEIQGEEGIVDKGKKVEGVAGEDLALENTGSFTTNQGLHGDAACDESNMVGSSQDECRDKDTRVGGEEELTQPTEESITNAKVPGATGTALEMEASHIQE